MLPNIDSDSSIEERNNARRRLNKGEIKFIFTVDLYNEGVDIPEINTVLFLRPTESPTIFIQQLGRGLRIAEGKDVLTVLDFIGQANKEFNKNREYDLNYLSEEEKLMLIMFHYSIMIMLLVKGCFIGDLKAEHLILRQQDHFTFLGKLIISLIQVLSQ